MKTRVENNIGGSRSTALEKSSGSARSQNVTVIRPVNNQAVEEELNHQSRDTSTRSLP